MSTNTSQDKQCETIAGMIAGLMKELESLAPHPDHLNTGPGGEHDSMLGQIFMDSFLGASFLEVASGTPDIEKMAESASQYMTDRSKGRSSFTLDRRRAITGHFNAGSSPRSTGMQAFIADLPKRKRVEGALTRYQGRLATIKAASPAPQIAA